MRSPLRKRLARQHFVAAHDRLAAAEIDDDVAVFDALDDAVDDVADAVLVFLVLAVALGLAHLLHDHLLGRLRGDAAVFERRQRVGDGVADLRGRIALARVLEADLVRRVLDRLDHQHVAREPQLAGLRVDLGVHVGLGAVARARRLGDRVLHRGDDDAAVDRLLAGDRVGDLQQFEPVGADGHRSVSFVLGAAPVVAAGAPEFVWVAVRARGAVARWRRRLVVVVAQLRARPACRAAATRRSARR